jgi:hypothetical protein
MVGVQTDNPEPSRQNRWPYEQHSMRRARHMRAARFGGCRVSAGRAEKAFAQDGYGARFAWSEGKKGGCAHMSAAELCRLESSEVSAAGVSKTKVNEPGNPVNSLAPHFER